jgi:hypothetical protein
VVERIKNYIIVENEKRRRVYLSDDSVGVNDKESSECNSFFFNQDIIISRDLPASND